MLDFNSIVFFLLISLLLQLVGGLAALFLFKKNEGKKLFLVNVEIVLMLLVVFYLLFESVEKNIFSLTFVVVGLVAVLLFDQVFPLSSDDLQLKRFGYVALIGLLVHKLAEGISFGSSAALSRLFGFSTAGLISLHDIPEGALIMLLFLVQGDEIRGVSAILLTQFMYFASAMLTFFLLISLTAQIQVGILALSAGILLFVVIRQFIFLRI